MSNLAYEFNEDERTELLDGRITMTAPQRTGHHVVADNIHGIFKKYLKGKQYKSFVDGIDVFLTKKDRVVPDVMIICNREIIKSHGIHGVREYWLVDTFLRSVEVYALRNGRYELDNIYETISETDLAVMTEQERNEIKREFSPVIFPEIILTLDEIFDDIDFINV